jgi:hypothetical protein
MYPLNPQEERAVSVMREEEAQEGTPLIDA